MTSRPELVDVGVRYGALMRELGIYRVCLREDRRQHRPAGIRLDLDRLDRLLDELLELRPDLRWAGPA